MCVWRGECVHNKLSGKTQIFPAPWSCIFILVMQEECLRSPFSLSLCGVEQEVSRIMGMVGSNPLSISDVTVEI